MEIVSVVNEGLGHSSHVVALGDGTALVIDPARLADRQRRLVARHVELSAVPGAEIVTEPVTVMCGHGERAMTAASLLVARCQRDVSVLAGGPAEWAAATGIDLSVER